MSGSRATIGHRSSTRGETATGDTGRKMRLYLLDINRIQHVSEDSLHFRPLSCLAKNLQTSQSKPALLDTFCFWLIQF